MKTNLEDSVARINADWHGLPAAARGKASRCRDCQHCGTTRAGVVCTQIMNLFETGLDCSCKRFSGGAGARQRQ